MKQLIISTLLVFTALTSQAFAYSNTPLRGKVLGTFIGPVDHHVNPVMKEVCVLFIQAGRHKIGIIEDYYSCQLSRQYRDARGAAFQIGFNELERVHNDPVIHALHMTYPQVTYYELAWY